MENWNKHCQVKVLQDHGINSCIGYNYLFIFAAEPDALSEYRSVVICLEKEAVKNRF